MLGINGEEIHQAITVSFSFGSREDIVGLLYLPGRYADHFGRLF
jgi:hypothetical protein